MINSHQVQINSLGLHTGLDMRNQTLEFMQANFGKAIAFYYWISRGVDSYTVQIQIRHIRSGPKNSVALDTDEKKFLRAYADAIKGVIDNSSLVPAKKDRLYDKINAFIKELDSERMPLQKFHDVILSLATTGAEAADKLEPAWKWVRLAAEVLSARQETEHKKLPPPPKEIKPPKRQIEPPKKARREMDDDIPF